MIDEHDPIDRQMPDEPRFVLLARDPLSDGLVALWAALRGRRTEAIRDIVANLVVAAGKLPYQPDKDPAHVQSARGISTAMLLWRIQNTPRTAENSRSVDLDGVTS